MNNTSCKRDERDVAFYKTLEDAIYACNRDPECGCIVDWGCDDDTYYTYKGVSTTQDSYGCSWQKDSEVKACKVDLLSYGGDDIPFHKGYKGFIKIDGRQVTKKEGSRGFTLARINDDCSVKEIKRYDTHISTQESYNLRDYLQSIPNNTRISGITYDEYADHLSSSAKSSLTNVGLNLTSTAWRSSLCFMLIKGKPQLTKQNQAFGAKGPSSLSATFEIV